jgi:hypothetical protein
MKLEALVVMLEITSGALPILLRETVCGSLGAPINLTLKARLVGPRLTIGAPPVPIRLTTCRPLPALSVINRASPVGPEAAGLNVTLIAQLAPAASWLPQLLTWVKLLVVVAMLAITRRPAPLFVRVTARVVPLAPTG